ncbi:hypothetical protein BG011_010007 [Mortierella polycephala]|uniref:Uncharacterized protein n=1 Tax=Mortierella polycephala TaxID=41804 RepID=A0A9P6Q850_9FUNG|nr:hypothetical protein BG011_010007 [Mortierella polycephala]
MPPPKWETEAVPSHKFDFINITDFHSSSPWTYLRYSWVWIMFLIAILVLCGEIWTCAFLIINGSWISEIEPIIDISIARWIFTACILLSFLLLAFDLKKANKVIKSQDISYAVSNPIVSGFYCLQKYEYFCFVEQIRNSDKTYDKLAFFVFFQLKGWKYLVVQAPRQIISMMILVAFMRALGFDFGHLDDLAHILPSLRDADKFTFCVMVFTSLMFIISGLATLFAALLWIPLLFKAKGNLKKHVCHKMDKGIDAVIKKTTQKRADRTQMLEELEEAKNMDSVREGYSVTNVSSLTTRAGIASAGGTTAANNGFSLKRTSFVGLRRPKPTLPDIDVILANTPPEELIQQRKAQQRQQRIVYTDRSPTLPILYSPHRQYNQYHSYSQQRQTQHQHQYPPPDIFRQSMDNSRGHGSKIAPSGSAFSFHPDSPIRQPSMTPSTPSFRTNNGSPNLARAAITNNVNATTVARSTSRTIPLAHHLYYTQQQEQQYYQQQAYPHAQLQEQFDLETGQNSHYHDSELPAHPPILNRVATSDTNPENWDAHYGFLVDTSSANVTPTATEHSAMYIPDSGVLPNTNDPCYMGLAGEYRGTEQRRGSSSSSSSSTRMGTVYRPDKTEMEQYDALYRDITQAHKKFMANRSMPIIRPSVSKTSLRSLTSEPSYTMTLRHQHQQLPYVGNSPTSTYQYHTVPTNHDTDPDRALSDLDPPQPTFNGSDSSGASMPSSPVLSFSPSRSLDRSVYQPQHHQPQHHQPQHHQPHYQLNHHQVCPSPQASATLSMARVSQDRLRSSNSMPMYIQQQFPSTQSQVSNDARHELDEAHMHHYYSRPISTVAEVVEDVLRTDDTLEEVIMTLEMDLRASAAHPASGPIYYSPTIQTAAHIQDPLSSQDSDVKVEVRDDHTYSI